jgi:hypothetical protein
MFRTASYYGTVEWEVDGAPMPDGFFRMDKVYTAKVTLFPVPGYVFPGGVTVTHTKADTAAMGAANPVQAEASFTFDTTILRLAAGGDVSLQWTGVPGYYYETHVFKTAGTYSLSFADPLTPSVTADILIVAGGGGAGPACNQVGTDRGGGGGAGGLLYRAGQTLLLSGGSVAITVGAGGAGGTAKARGANGGNSAIGGITVPGGGGGGIGTSDGSNGNVNGMPGGSGGGSGAFLDKGAGTPGNAEGVGILGNNGGKAGANSGGGGGGALGPGGNVPGTNQPGAGGAPWKPSGESAWIEQLTGTAEFSRGGRGGSYVGGGDGVAGVNYGDGGSGRNSKGAAGTAGHHGIVIIRFLNPGYTG